MTAKSKHTYVLGTGLAHDGSACLLKDGRISVAIEKERVTRHKHDGGNDTDAILYCLEAEGIGLDDLTLVVQNANFGLLKQGNNWWRGRRLFHERVPVVSISHHLAHAYSAVGTAPFDEAAVLIIDGCGSGMDDCLDLEGAVVPEQPPAALRHLFYEKDSYYVFKDNRVTPVYKDFSPWGLSLKDYPMCPNTTQHSIGGMYLAASMYVFSGFEDPGKLMGLAPYGRPGVYDFEIFDLRDGRAFVRYDWMERFRKPGRDYEQFKRDFQYYADIAYWMQREVERAVLYVARHRHTLAPSRNLAYAGGVALNAVANRRLLTETSFENVYIQPAAGDNGLAVGCAYYGWMEVLGRERVRHTGTMSLGRSYRRPADRRRARATTPVGRVRGVGERRQADGRADRRGQGRRLVPGRGRVRPARARPPQHPRRPAQARDAQLHQRAGQVPRRLPTVRALGAGRALLDLLRV